MMNPNRPLGFKNARRFAARDRAGAADSRMGV
jgi:hypothetical protein